MKILQLGDLHFEEAKHRRKAADGIDQGWHDVANAVDHLVDHAIAEKAGLIAFGGDLAVTRKPTPQTYERIAAAVNRSQDAGIPWVAIPGNHDIASAGEANALDPLAHLPGFHLFNEPGIAYVHRLPADWFSLIRRGRPEHPVTGSAPIVAIVCVPWLQRGTVAANLPADAPLEQVLDVMSAGGMAIIRDLAIDTVAAGIPTFLLYHGTVYGGTTPTGQLAHLFNEPVLSAVELSNLGLSGVMLNHLHRRQDIGTGGPGCPPIVYSSSVERLTFSDEHDDKGGVMWTVPSVGEPARYDWVDTPSRRFVTLTEWADSLGPWDVEDAIVRARFAPDCGLDIADVQRSLETWGAHRVTDVVIDSEEQRVEHAAADVARVDPLEALAEWMTVEHPDADASWRADVMDDAARLMGLAPEAAVVTPIDTPAAEPASLTLTA